MLTIFTLLIVGAVAYVYLTEGLVTASLMCVNVLLAGLVAFNFFEPLAGWLEDQAGGGFGNYADGICLTALFCLTLGLLRVTTNTLAPLRVEVHALVQSIGGGLFGALTGYLIAGFLVCVFQTLPLHHQFLGFDSTSNTTDGMRNYLPSDRVWLAMMRRAGAYAFANNEADDKQQPTLPDDLTDTRIDRFATFDRYGTYEMRYDLYRRHDDEGRRLSYRGEFRRELSGAPAD